MANQNKLTIVERVERLMVLPDEVPTLAKVTDIKKLEGQAFFKDAENGDTVLMFPLASKAILYRERTNKVINVTGILPTTTELTVKNIEVVNDSPLTVALFNGTERAGLAGKTEKQIKEKFNNIVIDSIADAASKNFETTTIIDITNKNLKTTNDLALLLGAKISPLPEGEAKPDVDLIIILGKNLE